VIETFLKQDNILKTSLYFKNFGCLGTMLSETEDGNKNIYINRGI